MLKELKGKTTETKKVDIRFICTQTSEALGDVASVLA